MSDLARLQSCFSPSKTASADSTALTLLRPCFGTDDSKAESLSACLPTNVRYTSRSICCHSWREGSI